MVPLIFDTDPGIDDTFALFYALASGRFDLRGVTTVFGNVLTPTATANALWLLEQTGHGHVPVAGGMSAPMNGVPHQAAVDVHGLHGFGDWPEQKAKQQAVAMDAADFMIAQSLERPGEIHVVAVGPLTNLAVAAQRDPQFPARIASLHVMGGAFRARGNITPFAEANIHNDPEAAQIVAQRYPNLRFVGLDVTDRIPLPLEDCTALADSSEQWGDFLREISRYYTAFYASVGKTAGASLHDPATLIALLRPELFQFERGEVRVDLEGETRGQTHFTSNAGSGGTATAEAAMSADFDEVRAEFMSMTRAWLAQQTV